MIRRRTWRSLAWRIRQVNEKRSGRTPVTGQLPASYWRKLTLAARAKVVRSMSEQEVGWSIFWSALERACTTGSVESMESLEEFRALVRFNRLPTSSRFNLFSPCLTVCVYWENAVSFRFLGVLIDVLNIIPTLFQTFSQWNEHRKSNISESSPSSRADREKHPKIRKPFLFADSASKCSNVFQ